jgi:RHS repeat-associated protein
VQTASRLALGVVALLALVADAASAQTPTEGIEYYATDAIGSIRIVFDVNGTVLGRQDYGPFGRELFPAPALPKERFAGQESDGESQQSHFHARQYQERTGRLTRVDPMFAGLFDPQASNRYSYAVSSPITFTDATGLQAKPVTDPNTGCTTTPRGGGFEVKCPSGKTTPWFTPPRGSIGGGSTSGGRGQGSRGGGGGRDRANRSLGQRVLDLLLPEVVVEAVPWDIVPAICSADSFTFVGGGGGVTDDTSVSAYRLDDVHYTGDANGWHVQDTSSGVLVEGAGHTVGGGVVIDQAGRINEGLLFLGVGPSRSIGTPEMGAHAGLGLVLGYGADGAAIGYYGEATANLGPAQGGGGAGWTLNITSALNCAKK